MRVEYPGTTYYRLNGGDRREDLLIFAGLVDCGGGANRHDQWG